MARAANGPYARPVAEYIRETGKALITDVAGGASGRVQFLAAFFEELRRLDPRDFAPASRATFVRQRAHLKVWVDSTNNLTGNKTLIQLLTDIIKTLADYGGPGRYAKRRGFDWLSSSEVQAIVERDYAELHEVLLPDGAWKSTVVMSGSLLEAILYDLMFKDAARSVTALAANAAPKASLKAGGGVLPFDDWKLHAMIKVAVEIGLLTKERAETFDQVLRDYRNFVHPAKELRSKHPCGEGEALMAKGAIDAVCDHFDRLRADGKI